MKISDWTAVMDSLQMLVERREEGRQLRDYAAMNHGVFRTEASSCPMTEMAFQGDAAEIAVLH
jgi:hypothetical protein